MGFSFILILLAVLNKALSLTTPTYRPTPAPTKFPSCNPSFSPTNEPTSPSCLPTMNPSHANVAVVKTLAGSGKMSYIDGTSTSSGFYFVKLV